MSSLRQIEANRHNALRSTGPKTENGKQRSRRNALRHGFTAETVIEPLESRDEYRAFEAAILTEYLPQTPVEQELVRRLASLFWRLRRATSIETGLLRLQSEILRGFRSSRQKAIDTATEEGEGAGNFSTFGGADRAGTPNTPGFSEQSPSTQPADPARDIAVSFLRLA